MKNRIITDKEKARGYEQIVCRLCGDKDVNAYIEETKQRMKEQQLCFSCNFWHEKIETDKQHPDRIAVVDGEHYTICPDQPPGTFGVGYGGSAFYIIFNDGRRVVSKNVWHQGDIPEHFKQYFPNNARFVTREEFSK